jgi:hypothetical protein
MACKFPRFFISLGHYTVVGKQLLISNDRNKVRWAVLYLSHDSFCTDSFETFSVKSLMQDQSNKPNSTHLFSHWSIPFKHSPFKMFRIFCGINFSATIRLYINKCGLPVYVVSFLIEVTGGSTVPKGHSFIFIFRAILTLTLTVKGTVRPNWISLRVVVSLNTGKALKRTSTTKGFFIF